MVTRRPSVCIAALLLALAHLDDGSTVLAQTGTAVPHRVLLQFNATVVSDVNNVVAGVSTLVADAVDVVANGLRFPTTTPRSSAQTPQATPAPAVTVVVTPEPTTPTAAPASTQAPTDAPSLEPMSEPTPAATPEPYVAETMSTPATDAPATAAPDTLVPTLAVEESTPAPTEVPGTPAPSPADTPVPSTVSGDGSATLAPQLNAMSSTGSGNGAELEANVLPAVPSAAPSDVPTAAPSAVALPVRSAAPIAAAPLPVAVPPSLPVAVRDSSASSSSLAGAGQVHAPNYSGSMAYAVRGVGKNASDPSSPAPSKRPKKTLKTAASTGSGSQAASAPTTDSVESSNTASGGIYNLGTSSILSIVGVIVGICAIVGLFVVISRKKYGDESDDDELPMAYGYRIDGGSVVRLSPTFLQNGESSMIGGNGNSYGPGGSTYDVDNTSSSGESGEERVPYFGSSYGFDNYLATSHMMKSVYGGGPPAIGSSRRSSALLASDLKSSIYSSEASDGSETWSSVMASECEQGTVSRCTRDTTLSAITMPANSETDRRATDNNRSTYGEALSEVNFDASSNYRSTGASSVYRDESMAYSSSLSSALGDSKSSNASSAFYRNSGRSTGVSDYDVRSTGASSSIYSVGDPSPFDV